MIPQIFPFFSYSEWQVNSKSNSAWRPMRSTDCQYLLVVIAVVVIVNDNVFVNVTCGGVTATVVAVAPAWPTIWDVSTPAAEAVDDADAVTGREVMICWICVPPAILWALDLTYDCGVICWTTTCCCLKITGDVPACSLVTGCIAAQHTHSTVTSYTSHSHCLCDKREDHQNCSVLCTIDMSSELRRVGLGFVFVFCIIF